MLNMLTVNLFGIVISFQIFKSGKVIIGGVLEKGVLKNFINVIKKRLRERCFSMNFAKFLRTIKVKFPHSVKNVPIKSLFYSKIYL